MNTKSKRSPIVLALAWAIAGISFTAVAAHAAPQLGVSEVLYGMAGLGEPSASDQAAQLLVQARQAMDEGNLDIADSCLMRAEKLNPRYSFFHRGDTIKKVRADLTKMHASAPPAHSASAGPASTGAPAQDRPATAAAAASPTTGQAAAQQPSKSLLPSKLFNPALLGQSNKAPKRDPFQIRQDQLGDSADATTPPQQVADLPTLNPTTRSPVQQASGNALDPAVFENVKQGPLPTADGLPALQHQVPQKLEPAGNTANQLAAEDASLAQQNTPSLPNPLTPVGAPNARMESDRFLLGARRALAVGDTRSSIALLNQSKAMQVKYGAEEDSPAKVETLIGKYVELTTSGNSPDSDSFRRRYSLLLMEQSQELLRWREFDEAERLAEEARRQPIKYGNYEATPDMLLSRIEAARRQVGSGVTPVGFSGAINSQATATPTPSALPVQAPQQTAAASQSPQDSKQQALNLTRQAHERLAAGDLDNAEQLVRQAMGLAPDSAYGPQDLRPRVVLYDIQKARLRTATAPQADATGPNGGATQAAAALSPGEQNTGVQTIYNSTTDKSRVVQATGISGAADSSTGPELLPDSKSAAMKSPRMAAVPKAGSRSSGAPDVEALPLPPPAIGEKAGVLYKKGEAALMAGNADEALGYFRAAYAKQDQLDAATRQRLQDHLQLLSARPLQQRTPDLQHGPAATAQAATPVKKALAQVAKAQTDAREMQVTAPKKGLELLKKTKEEITANKELDQQSRQQLLRRLDITIHDSEQFIIANRAEIELNEKNKAVRERVKNERNGKVDNQDRLAQITDECNKLLEERRFEEAERLAKKAAELDPENPAVVALVTTCKMVRRMELNREIQDKKEDAVVESFLDADRAMIPFNKNIEFPDIKKWRDLTKTRSQLKQEDQLRKTERDRQIEAKLSTQVSVNFKERPLNEVLNYLAKLADVNMFIDTQALAEDGVSPDTQVSIELKQDISLKSALKLILEPLHLGYVVSDEVLKITSANQKQGKIFQNTYQVADLIVPIPNFVPNGNDGISAALTAGFNRVGAGGTVGGFGSQAPLPAIAANTGARNTTLNPGVMAAMQRSGAMPNSISQPSAFGPGGLGGGSLADFDPLIELIEKTISPESWDTVGGRGSIAPYDTSLSLVISNTQEVHEEIVDLLNQLRRLQDLQVTIEVRFITLSDTFFERIGVDFDFNINDNSQYTASTLPDHPQPSVTIGLDPAGSIVPTANLDVEFRQGGFNSALPPFGNDPASAATFGFAILSDIEAFFVIQAAQGDSRTNILQAPKVTLFNGQQAFVSDTSQRPFVTSVIPVVGDFAAAQQPVIVVLSEGTSLTVQAVVSSDRRFVRMTVVPFFSSIGDVSTFTFTGSTTSTTKTADSKDADDSTTSSDEKETTTDGTTVQLPTFSYVTVTTTVSVPDGGTVLLGGIKRLSEGRNERGVPILSKLPYINRLFNNVGIGRTTQSLMLMVTPRIIIQEEEEANLLGQQPSS